MCWNDLIETHHYYVRQSKISVEIISPWYCIYLSLCWSYSGILWESIAKGLNCHCSSIQSLPLFFKQATLMILMISISFAGGTGTTGTHNLLSTQIYPRPESFVFQPSQACLRLCRNWWMMTEIIQNDIPCIVAVGTDACVSKPSANHQNYTWKKRKDYGCIVSWSETFYYPYPLLLYQC